MTERVGSPQFMAYHIVRAESICKKFDAAIYVPDKLR
jgi:hypothetical protein